MKKLLAGIVLCITSLSLQAQSGYEVTINLKNCKDTLAYLTYYQMDKQFIKDTCTKITNGKIIFKGSKKLDTGVYTLVSQEKKTYFDFFIDDTTQKLELSSEVGPAINQNLVALNSQRENDFFNYIKFITKQNIDFLDLKQKTALKTKKDTLAFNDKQKELENGIVDYEINFMAQHKGTFIADVINLKMDKKLRGTAKPDIEKEFKYYKSHYWDNVNFQDDATMKNPFFYGKLKKYFDNVVLKEADTVIVEIDRIMDKTIPGSSLNKSLLAYFTYSNETSEVMGFDKVFVHMADKYFKTGKAKGVYEEENIAKVIKRADKLRPLLVGATALELFMVKAEDFDKMKKMGFEDAKNNEEITALFYKHTDEINKLFTKLSDVRATYTILVFWDVDCGHCQIEIPKLLDVYNEMLKDKIDVKVYSVYMQHEGDKYLKYIAEHKLPWINVYDGAHYNNAIEKYDVYSTPVIYLLDKNKVIKAKRISVDVTRKIIDDLEKERKKK